MKRKRTSAGNPPLEYSLLLTATLCLLAFGAVMVFSASSATSLLGSSGDSAYFLKRTILFGVVGLLIMRLLSLRGGRVLRPLTPLLVVGSFVLLVVVLVPGIGQVANGARRWIGAGLIQVQPSEIAKLALVLYGAHLLARRPAAVRDIRSMTPYLAVVVLACGLIYLEPDLGTAIVCGFSVAAVLIAAGARLRHLALIGAAIGLVVLVAALASPYQSARLTGFLHPGTDPTGAGFQSHQAMIALGHGGLFGVGLGQSVQKIFYLPEAHTDMIGAVIGEEVGLLGIGVLVGLFGLFGLAGFRTAKLAKDRYGKLLAAGLTSMILVQATINLFALMGMAPLTGVPLPFVSYGNSSLLVTLAAVGLILNVARGGTAAAARPASETRRRTTASHAKRRTAASKRAAAKLRLVEGGQAATTRRKQSSVKGGHSRRRNRGTRGSRDSGRRRAAG